MWQKVWSPEEYVSNIFKCKIYFNHKIFLRGMLLFLQRKRINGIMKKILFWNSSTLISLGLTPRCQSNRGLYFYKCFREGISCSWTFEDCGCAWERGQTGHLDILERSRTATSQTPVCLPVSMAHHDNTKLNGVRGHWTYALAFSTFSWKNRIFSLNNQFMINTLF